VAVPVVVTVHVPDTTAFVTICCTTVDAIASHSAVSAGPSTAPIAGVASIATRSASLRTGALSGTAPPTSARRQRNPPRNTAPRAGANATRGVEGSGPARYRSYT